MPKIMYEIQNVCRQCTYSHQNIVKAIFVDLFVMRWNVVIHTAIMCKQCLCWLYWLDFYVIFTVFSLLCSSFFCRWWLVERKQMNTSKKKENWKESEKTSELQRSNQYSSSLPPNCSHQERPSWILYVCQIIHWISRQQSVTIFILLEFHTKQQTIFRNNRTKLLPGPRTRYTPRNVSIGGIKRDGNGKLSEKPNEFRLSVRLVVVTTTRTTLPPAPAAVAAALTVGFLKLHFSKTSSCHIHIEKQLSI